MLLVALNGRPETPAQIEHVEPGLSYCSGIIVFITDFVKNKIDLHALGDGGASVVFSAHGLRLNPTP